MSTDHVDDATDGPSAAQEAVDISPAAKDVEVIERDDDEDEFDDEEEEEEDDDENPDAVSLGFAMNRDGDEGALLRNMFPSKLGGEPAWLDPQQLPLERRDLRCLATGLPLRFLLQVYAPVSGDRAFHRTIYVFISPKGSKLENRGAVRAFRSQLPRLNDFYPYEAPEDGDKPAPLPPAALAVASRRCPRFAEGAQGGGDAGGADGGSAQTSSGAAMVDEDEEEAMRPSWMDAASNDGAAETAAVGATAAVGGDTTAPASVAAATPRAAAAALPPQTAFKEHELVVEPEPDATEGGEAAASANDDVKRLMQQYNDKIRDEKEVLGAASTEDKTEMFDEKRDAEVEAYARFSTRVNRAPEQCLRYTFASNATPLWPSKRRQPDEEDIPPCPRCGARRRFEFQVMPQAIDYLGVDSWEVESPDFATIAVYTCAESCAPTPPLPAHGLLDDPPSRDAAEATAAVGLSCTLTGLSARAELNGKRCTVLYWHAKSGRWAVECAESGERLRIRSQSLRPVRPVAVGAGADGDEPFLREGGYAEEFVWVQVH